MRFSRSMPYSHLAVLHSAFALSLLLLFGLTYTFLPSRAFDVGAICLVLFASAFPVVLLCYEGPARPLEVLPLRPMDVAGHDPEDVSAEVQAITLASGTTAIRCSLHLLRNGTKIGDLDSAIGPGDSVADALRRSAAILNMDGLGFIEILTGDGERQRFPPPYPW